MTDLKESPSQTAGPYVHIGCTPNFCDVRGVYTEDPGAVMVNKQTKGDRITVTGIVYDGAGTPLLDALVEIWQADANGIYPGQTGADPNFKGWGRKAGDYDTGEWSFDTVKPGAVPLHNGKVQAPHLSFWIVARGINLGLQTRMYFPGDDHSVDPVLTAIEDQTRIPTLIAQKSDEGCYRFDIRLKGDGETIFFDF